MALNLAFLRQGTGGPTVVVLHGLLGAARNWSSIAKQLALRYQVISADLRNHGASPWAKRMTYDDMAGDLRGLIQKEVPGPAIVIGHSMGGKVAMRLALTQPDLISHLVVVDIAPAAYRHDFGDYVTAMQKVEPAAFARRADVDQALAATVPEPAIRAFLMQNLVRARDQYRWRVNLDAIAANMTELMDFPTGGARPFAKPTLFVAGEHSSYIRRQDRPVIEQLFPTAELVTVTDASHWVHADQPTAFLAHVTAFLGQA